MRVRLTLTTLLLGAGIALLALGAGPPTRAQSLRIGVQAETTSVDPHFAITNPAVAAARHMFDTLAHPDARQKLHPGLALSWVAISATEWEFRLRPGVRFHDGTAFTAADVAFSLARAPEVPSPFAGFRVLTRQITGMQVVDPMTIRLRTEQPFPLMAEHLSAVPIVSHIAAQGMGTADFNSGKATIGTGPFRYVSWVKADSLRLARNDAYWGNKAAWQEVAILPIPDDGARVAALLSGTVDMIDLVPPAMLANLQTRPSIALAATPSNRIIYLTLNVMAGNVMAGANPQITDAAGQVLPQNPFADRRVRLAISKAINREMLTARVLEGAAIPAAQLLPDGYPGTSAQLHPEPHDPAGARALLAAAGFPDGFAVVVTVPRDRNVSDVKIGEAVAQMLSRIGLRATLDALPFSMTQTRNQRGEFAIMLRGWGTETGEGSMALRSLLGTRDPVRGWGTVNGSGYSNPGLDALLTQAQATMEASPREALVAQAMELGMRDVGLVPLHYQMAIWSFRRGLSYVARSDNYTFAFDVHPAPQ